MEVSVRQRNHADKRIARTVIELSGNDWQRYEFRLDIPAAKIAPLDPADFVIAVGAKHACW